MEIKSLVKAPKIIGNKVMPRFSDTLSIYSKEKNERIRKTTVNGTPYIVRSIFGINAKTPTEKIAKWIDLDLKNNY